MSTSAIRTLKILKSLKGHTLNGLSNTEISHAINDTPSNTCRALDVLIKEGMVSKLETGRYALSVQALQIAVSHAEEMNKATSRISQLNQRIIAGANND